MDSPDAVTAEFMLVIFIPVMGILAGLVSLCGLRPYGEAGILWKSVAGLFICGLLVLGTVPGYLIVRSMARHRYEDRYGHPPP